MKALELSTLLLVLADALGVATGVAYSHFMPLNTMVAFVIVAFTKYSK